jgi:neutral amino acid transport system permease protein
MLFIQLIVNGVVQGLVIGLAALAVTLVFGIARFPNASAGDAMTLGAYGALAGHRATGSFVIAGLSAILVAILASILAYATVFRRLAERSVVALMVAAIGVGLIIRAVLGLAFGHLQYVIQVPLSRPYVVSGVRLNLLDLQLALVTALALAIVFVMLHHTSIGRQMRAVADDRELSRVSGIQPERVMIALWILSGALTAVAGVVIGIKTVVTTDVGWEMLLPVFAATIFGGIGSPVGAVVAGLILGIAQEVSTPFVGFTYKIALSFFVILFVLLIRPTGLFGWKENVR